MASTAWSDNSPADISGCRSYVATFGDGTMMRSSPGKRFLASAIEEIRDMRIFLGFRPCAVACGRQPATTSPRILCSDAGAKQHAHAGRQRVTVMRHARGGGKFHFRARANPSNSGSSNASRISRTRSARKLKHSSESPSRMPVVTIDHGRLDEFVGHILRIRGLNRSGLDARGMRALRARHCLVGKLHAIPPAVAIHRIIPAGNNRRQRRPPAMHASITRAQIRGRCAARYRARR